MYWRRRILRDLGLSNHVDHLRSVTHQQLQLRDVLRAARPANSAGVLHRRRGVHPDRSIPYAPQGDAGVIGLDALRPVFRVDFWFWQEDSYWAEPSALKPLLHTWSLAIEEQFYLLFPVVLLVLWRFAGGVIAIFFTVVFLAFRSWAPSGQAMPSPGPIFLLPARGWELLAGALLAKIEIDHGRKGIPVLDALMPAVGLFLIGYAVFLFDGRTTHPSLITALPIAGTMLLIWFARKGEPLTEILSSKIVVGVGLISYSLYLWHFPIFALSRIEDGTPSNLERMALIALCVLLAFLTYIFAQCGRLETARTLAQSVSGSTR
jgi:peptidoglycan/LPS O-acetylase OafA/YrhL